MLFKDKIYGQIDITEPVILELIKTPQMQRLKKIHQYGVYFLFYPEADTNRFEHSLGVYRILKEFGAALTEQIAGLLHDISHGVFSHVMDHLHGSVANEEYQDTLHQQYFKKNEIAKVLEQYGIDSKEIGDLANWPLLDNQLPNICADRLQYTLADAVTINKISTDEAFSLISGLTVENGQFIFLSLAKAKDFAELSLWMCINFWHSDWGCYSFCLMSDILKKSIQEGVLSAGDLFSDDEKIVQKLNSCPNQEIKDLFNRLKLFKRECVFQNKGHYEYFKGMTKFRVIDPLIKINGQIKKITELFPDFKNSFENEKQRVSRPRYLKYLIE